MNSRIKSILPILLCASVAATLLCAGCKDDNGEPGFDCPEEGKDYYSADTEIGKLYEFCFGGTEDCRDFEAAFLLYLDTSSLPRPGSDDRWVSLNSIPASGTFDVVSVAYSDTIPFGLYEQLQVQPGWKVSMAAARIEFCETCFTNCGLAKIIQLSGEPGSVEFVYDPLDTLGVHIDYRPIE